MIVPGRERDCVHNKITNALNTHITVKVQHFFLSSTHKYVEYSRRAQ